MCFNAPPHLPTSATFARPEASNSDLLWSGFDSLLFVENSNAADAALDRAYEDRIQAVRDATGVVLQNPLYLTQEQAAGTPGGQLPVDALENYAARSSEARAAFEQQLRDTAQKFPEAAALIRPDQSVDDDALVLAREADNRFSQALNSRDDLWKWAAAFGGSAIGSLNDPATLGSMFLGGGAGGARTIGGRILTTAFSEMLVNGATEAAIQPSVQAWRERAGLPHGFDQAVSNVAFAGAFGAVFGAGARALHEGARALSMPQSGARALDGVELPERTRAALDGDPQAAREMLGEVRDQLPPEVRGALDALDREDLAAAQKPDPIEAEFHDHMLAQAELAMREGRAPPEWVPDEAEVRRLADRLAPLPDSHWEPLVDGEDLDQLLGEIKGKRPEVTARLRPAYQFLKGQIDPDSNLAAELRAAGITSKTHPGLYKRGDAALDQSGNRIVGELDNIPLDEAVDAMPGLRWEDDGQGYVPTQVWYDALVDEYNGHPWLDAHEAQSLESARRFDEREAYLKGEGVDFSADPATIKRQLADLAQREREILDPDPGWGLPQDWTPEDGTPLFLAHNQFATETVREFYQMAGPGIDERVIEAAFRDVMDNFATPRDALDRAMGIDRMPFIDPALFELDPIPFDVRVEFVPPDSAHGRLFNLGRELIEHNGLAQDDAQTLNFGAPDLGPLHDETVALYRMMADFVVADSETREFDNLTEFARTAITYAGQALDETGSKTQVKLGRMIEPDHLENWMERVREMDRAEATAIVRRDTPPEPDGIDDPGNPPEWMAELDDVDFEDFADDDLLPGEDGPVSVAEMRDAISAAQNLELVTRACKT